MKSNFKQHGLCADFHPRNLSSEVTRAHSCPLADHYTITPRLIPHFILTQSDLRILAAVKLRCADCLTFL